MWSIEQLKYCKESEDKVEFKKGEHGNVAYDGGSRLKPSERRRCILGYVTALCNEKGGSLVIGMEDKYPHKVVGTRQNENSTGELEANIYRDTGIRPKIYELYEDEAEKKGRVLVIDVPSRPAGTVFKFEDVPLMRVGEELKPMSDEVYLSIIQENEPDFSQQICRDATLDELDPDALSVLKEKYARKQNNPIFLTLSNRQILSDLQLITDEGVTNAAVILLGKEDFIKRVYPQASVMLEYRHSESQITFDNRISYSQPFFIMIDRLWHDIDLRNGKFQIKEGPYIFDVPYFNEEVIRESINNAITHRDYTRHSETVIKQYPQKLIVTNAGGFPHGVTIDNILTVPSTPRNRLLADVLSKTGIVERSGQGIDKIFYRTLSEGKEAPDYSGSDAFNVELILSAIIQDKAFALFIESVQQNLAEDNKLSVFEIVVLDKIRRNEKTTALDKAVIKQLMDRNLIEKRGKTNGIHYILCRSYYEFTGNTAEYSKKSDWNTSQVTSIIIPFLTKYNKAKMGDFVKLLDGHLTRRQVRVYIQHMVDQNILTASGKGYGTYYEISNNYKRNSVLIDKAFILGIEELKKRGELKWPNNDQEKDDK
ncbi:ATP-binding protein [uncultured Prevotella sp.]|uniref:ATP-binding protein n=1 Tax=uncultured Prevotella sp. TaxID=159272 RepID=UPI0026750ECA|nr:ATP-binding protein [uncultured Prevotella sp.]